MNRNYKKKLKLIKIITVIFTAIAVTVYSFLAIEYKETKDKLLIIKRIEIRAYKIPSNPEKER